MFNQIFEVDKRMGVSQMQGVIITAVAIGIVGACYAIFGGLKAVAVSDTLNGIGLIIGGFMIPIFGLLLLGNDNFLAGLRDLISVVPAEKFNAINPAHAMAPMIPWPVSSKTAQTGGLTWKGTISILPTTTAAILPLRLPRKACKKPMANRQKGA